MNQTTRINHHTRWTGPFINSSARTSTETQVRQGELTKSPRQFVGCIRFTRRRDLIAQFQRPLSLTERWPTKKGKASDKHVADPERWTITQRCSACCYYYCELRYSFLLGNGSMKRYHGTLSAAEIPSMIYTAPRHIDCEVEVGYSPEHCLEHGNLNHQLRVNRREFITKRRQVHLQ